MADAEAADRRPGFVAPVLLAATLLALAWVPDQQILRSKLLWTEAALLAAAAAVLVGQAFCARTAAPPARVLIATALPFFLACAWLACASPTSRTLARDECERLLLAPLALWTAAVSAQWAGWRRALLGLLVLAVIPVAMYAVGQNLADLLALPIRRVERPASTFGNPGFLAAFLVLVTPLGIAATLFERGVLRWGGAVAAGFALPALYATQTRGAWMGFAAACVLGILILSPSAAWRRILVAGLCVAGALLLLLNLDVLQRRSEHALIWRDTTRMVAEHPWGVGPGQFQPAFLPYASPELLAAYPRATVVINDAHCEPLQMLAELGWLGLLAAVASLVVLGRAAAAAVKTATPGDRVLAVGLACGLFGHAVMSLTSPDLRFVSTSIGFYLLAGLLLACGGLPWRSPPKGARLGLALAGVALLGFDAWRTDQRLEIHHLLTPPSSVPAAKGADLSALRAAVRSNPRDPKAHFDLGLGLGGDGRWAEAADAFRAAYVLGSGEIGVLRNMALMQALAGQVDEALPNLRVVLEQRPADEDARYMLALVEFSVGDVASATRNVERLLADHPQHRLGRLLLERLRE